MLSAVRSVDRGYPGVASVSLSMDREQPQLAPPGALGANVASRVRVSRPLPQKALLYLPDRVLDLIDIVTFDVHVGSGLYANLHVTRACQLGLGMRAATGLGVHGHRSIGLQGQGEGSAVAGPAGTLAYAGGSVGTSGIRGTADAFTGLHRPACEVYQSYLDYWALGAAAMLGAVGAEVDVHPVQIWDFLAGFGMVDLLKDDFAQTRGLKLTSDDKSVLRHLGYVRQSEESMLGYREWCEDGRKY